MQDFNDKVIVITGAASGIGRALANHFAGEGARIVLADVDAAGLEIARSELEKAGSSVLAATTDVSAPDELAALAEHALERFGVIDVVCANAGVMQPQATVWESPWEDYEWVFGVNLYGVIHTVRAFVPRLLEGTGEKHIVITGSMSGLSVAPGNGVYQMSKHAVVALAETLFHELAESAPNIGVSVLCPGFVPTRITEGERVRPDHLRVSRTDAPRVPSRGWGDKTVALAALGVPAERVAELVLEAVRDRRFWILTHPDALSRIRSRFDSLMGEGNPRVDLGLSDPLDTSEPDP